MGLFGGRKSNFIGIDFGTSAIKVVELSYKNQKPFLENYGWFDLSGISQTGDLNQQMMMSYEDKFKMSLVSLLRKMNLKSKGVAVSIPGFSGLVVLIDFPNMDERDVEKAIEFEARKYVPTAIEDVSISWEILKDKSDNEQKNRTEVLLVAAPKKEVQKLTSLFEDTGFNVDAIELETFSIARSVIGKEPGTFLLIDVGCRATNLILVKDGTVVVNRTVDVGGNDITTTISESLSISKQRAESFKKEGKDFINERETAIVMPSLELLTNEAKRIITSFKEKNKNIEISKIILSGGSSELQGIEKYFFSRLNIETTKGNPLKNISFDPKVAPFLGKISTSFSVAIGLALRGIEEEYLNKK